jgi:preprotein translocase subunit SecE
MTEIWSELRKVTWPTFAETRYLTFVVIVVAVAVGVVLGVVDIFFNWLIDRLLLS